MIESVVISLILTVIIEVILAAIIGLRGEDNFNTVIWVNCLTNPIVVTTTNLTYILFESLMIKNIVIAILEISVVFIEGFLFRKSLKDFKINPYLFALYLNALSFSIGIIIDYFI